jgi:sigma-B regulation protein RsbU (phosphoserine phosphatase)
MKNRSSRTLYLLLCLWVAISMSYYVLGTVALREEFFHSAKYASDPFDFKDDLQTIQNLSDAQKKLGLENGSILRSVNGQPYTGWMQLTRIVHNGQPGDLIRVGVTTPQGLERQFELHLSPRQGPDFSLAGYIAFLLPILGVPLLGLLVGYWVVAGRPRDLNAWLVLMLLSFPGTAFANIDWRFWTGWTYPILGIWNLLIQHLAFIALLWFGIFFPERSRFDVRWPWLKWTLLGVTLITLSSEASQTFFQHYDLPKANTLGPVFHWMDIVTSWVAALCVVLFLLAIIDKLLTSPTPDAKRRVRVLAIGSTLSLGPLLVIFGILPRFGIDPHHGSWFEAVVPFVALFPLTLAYVLIVQRAMDVRILLRMGTKYLLARATIVGLEVAFGGAVIFGLLVPMMQKKEHQALNLVLLVAAIAGLVRVFVMRDSLSSRMQQWLDRKFFREEYNSEVVLSELSEQTRRFIDKGPLMETISRRISEILHVPQIAVWLRGSRIFQLQQAVGLDLQGPVLLTEDSMTVQNLTRTNRPATVYQDRPEEWFEQAGDGEKETLKRVNAELLLPLPGRERLMGLMTLGPKLSEQPYTPTDLRVLQSLAIQTGLALEISELALSLANEAAHRERINREIEIAREVQQRLFPQKLPQIPGLDFAGVCRAALGVGGDYYDLIQLENGKLGLAIGDVSGKGISAALLMSGLRASLRGVTMDGSGNLAKMMQRINGLVYESSASNRYATFFFATLDPATREVHYVNAGHNAPMLVRSGSGQVIRLEAGGTPVGLLPGASYEEQSVTMTPGDLLLCYTDGISEAMNLDDEEWGEDRMLEAVKKTPGAAAKDVLHEVFRAADEFAGEAPQHDDMTLLIARIEPSF